MTAPDAELDALVAMLSDAGLAEPYPDDDGRPALRLADRGAQVGCSSGAPKA